MEENQEQQHVEAYEKLLVIVVDTNPVIWGCTGNTSLDDPALQSLSFTKMIESVLLFANAHLMMHPYHRCAMIASHNTGSEILFPLPGDQSQVAPNGISGSGQHEVLSRVNQTIIGQLKAMAAVQEINPKKNCYTMLAAALCRSLCFIQRETKEMPVGRGLKARILTLYASNDNSTQYMPIMNAIFAAQKKKISIDSCVLSSKPSSFLQQASEITEGLYVQVESRAGLLEHLLTLFLADQDERQMLRLPKMVEVDYRAACFCHNRIINLGYVCTVCLSIFCEKRGVCSTCHSRFKIRAVKP